MKLQTTPDQGYLASSNERRCIADLLKLHLKNTKSWPDPSTFATSPLPSYSCIKVHQVQDLESNHRNQPALATCKTALDWRSDRLCLLM